MKIDFTPYLTTLRKLCEVYHVQELYAFGSTVRGNAQENSDVDIVVSFGEVDLYYYFDNYLNFRTELEVLFRRKVDLVESQTIKNPFLKQSIEQNKLLLYGHANRQMATRHQE